MNQLYTISGYERRRVEVEIGPKVMQPAVLDFSSFPIDEVGIQVSVDVNNKPSGAKAGYEKDLSMVLERQETVFGRLPDILGLEGLL
jgi:hypothetical protein